MRLVVWLLFFPVSSKCLGVESKLAMLTWPVVGNEQRLERSMKTASSMHRAVDEEKRRGKGGAGGIFTCPLH